MTHTSFRYRRRRNAQQQREFCDAQRRRVQRRWEKAHAVSAGDPVREERVLVTLVIEHADGDAIRIPIVARPTGEDRATLRIGGQRFSARRVMSMIRGAVELAGCSGGRKGGT